MTGQTRYFTAHTARNPDEEIARDEIKGLLIDKAGKLARHHGCAIIIRDWNGEQVATVTPGY